MTDKEKEETSSSNGAGTEAWGTLEELLLACAVNRHGIHRWDSIAKELQKRMKHAFSPRNCKQKYVDLKRRFLPTTTSPTASSAFVQVRGNDDDELLRMVDELRKLRVEELKREVQLHDNSIMSLQLKVKRLEEGRGRSLSTAEEPEAPSDLRIEADANATGIGGKPEEPERSSAEKIAPGDSSEDRSFNESNSTNHNKPAAAAPEKQRESKPKREPEEKEVTTSRDPDPIPVRVLSRSKVEPKKDNGWGSERVGNTSLASRLGELGESVSESQSESAKQQQSSDVQSSARLSKRKRRRFRGLGGGGSSGDDLEADEVSPANKRTSVKSQPLIRFLEILRSHKHGSVFQRRLPSQETEKYRNVIRQHMDLDTVESRIEKGYYSQCQPMFYRDLLLIFTNAVLFYRKSSAEHIAARELRKLVIHDISHPTHKPEKIRSVKPELDPEPQQLELEPVVKKPRSSTTMVICRRRSSSSVQALSQSMSKKDESNHSITKTISKNNSNDGRVEKGGDEEKAKCDLEQQKKVDGSKNSIVLGSRKEKEKEDGGATGGTNSKAKVVAKERTSMGRGGLRLNGKKMSSKEGKNREKEKVEGKCKEEEISSGGEMRKKRRKKEEGDEKQDENKGRSRILKKEGVANFLKRMKQEKPKSNEGGKEEESKEKKRGDNNGKRINNSHNNNKGDNGRRNMAGRRGDNKELEMGASRKAMGMGMGMGRPPKRKAAMMSSSMPDSGKGGTFVGAHKSKKNPRK